MYRVCIDIVKNKQDIPIPSYPWFLLQFRPTTKTASNILHHTGRFKVKRMVQARTLRKYNVDSHYTNTIYSFLRQRASKNIHSVSFASVDAKCKVLVGEPDYPIASVLRGKSVIVGTNQIYKVGEHNFSKFSLIPDVILMHDIPYIEDTEHFREENDDSDTDKNDQHSQPKTAMGSWYGGQVFYGIKTMPSEGSTAWRGVTELKQVLQRYYTVIPERLYIYGDGGGDRRITFLRVKTALVAIFLTLDLDELISARPAAVTQWSGVIQLRILDCRESE